MEEPIVAQVQTRIPAFSESPPPPQRSVPTGLHSNFPFHLANGSSPVDLAARSPFIQCHPPLVAPQLSPCSHHHVRGWAHLAFDLLAVQVGLDSCASGAKPGWDGEEAKMLSPLPGRGSDEDPHGMIPRTGDPPSPSRSPRCNILVGPGLAVLAAWRGSTREAPCSCRKYTGTSPRWPLRARLPRWLQGAKIIVLLSLCSSRVLDHGLERTC